MAFRGGEGGYAPNVGSPYSAMGALGDIALQQHKLDRLGAGDPYGSIAKEGTLFLKDLVNVFRTPDDEGRAHQAVLNEAAEAMGPALAQEQGIPVEQAKQQIAGGIAPPEPPYKKVLRTFGLGGDAPAGEDFDTRVAKIRGMARRLGFARQQRQEGQQEFGRLLTLAQKLRDPSVLKPQLQKAAQQAGYGDLGDAELAKTPGSLWEWAQQNNMTPEQYAAMTRPPRQKSEAELEEEAFTSGDPQQRKWAKARMWGRMHRGGGGAGRGSQKPSIFEKMILDDLKSKRDAIVKDFTLTPEEKQQRLTALMAEAEKTLRAHNIGGDTADAYQGGHSGEPDAGGAPEATAPPPDDSDDFLDSLALPPTTPPDRPQTSTTVAPPRESTTTTPPFRPDRSPPTIPYAYGGGTGLGGY